MDEIYKTICNLLSDFENSTDNPEDDDYLSDGQWLDEFYTVMVKAKNEIEISQKGSGAFNPGLGCFTKCEIC